MASDERPLVSLCALAARSVGARRAFWIRAADAALVAAPRPISPREVEWRWVDELRCAGGGLVRRGPERLARALRTSAVRELWLAGGEQNGGVLGLEFQRRPEAPDELALRELAALGRSLDGLDAARRAAGAQRENAERGRHVGRLVHDLRHQLTLARVLSADRGAGGEDERRIGELDAVLDTASDLCAQALRAPDELLQLEELELLPAVHEAARRALRLAARGRSEEHGVRLKVRVGAGLSVLARRTALTRLLVNLTSNAVEATPSGAAVRIEAFRREGRVVIDVTDEGRGFDPAERGALIEGRRVARGEHGFGFESARSAADELGCVLDVRSRPGAGTRVRVAFPLDAQRETILLLDADVHRRRALAAALARAGWGSVECATPAEALRGLTRGPRAVAVARGTPGEGLGRLVTRARVLRLPCFTLASSAEGASARERAGEITARLSRAVSLLR